MEFDEYGKENTKTIIMLHNINIVYCFQKQLKLRDKYHLIMPHIMGFGRDTKRIFKAQFFVNELANFIKKLNKKVYLVGYGLGAELGFLLLSLYPELIERAILISPWLIKDKKYLTDIYNANIKELLQIKNKYALRYIGFANRVPKAKKQEFYDSIMNINVSTIHNAIFDNISLEANKELAISKPQMVAIAGSKEASSVILSVKGLKNLNPNCYEEIWEGAQVNIPTKRARRLNDLIKSIF